MIPADLRRRCKGSGVVMSAAAIQTVALLANTAPPRQARRRQTSPELVVLFAVQIRNSKNTGNLQGIRFFEPCVSACKGTA